jgi:hypothetical protein
MGATYFCINIAGAMKRNRVIFYLVFAAFHLGIFFFTLLVDLNRDDWGFLGSMFRLLPTLKYISIFGVAMMALDIGWAWLMQRSYEQDRASLLQEVNSLKARVYDLQQAASSGK